MKAAPIYIFKNINSTGVSKVPLSGLILIRDVNEKPMIATKTAENGNDIVSDFLASTDYDVLGGKSELERIKNSLYETAWRMLGKNGDFYLDPGLNSIDFSHNTGPDTDLKGTKGIHSFAEGYNVIAEGDYSHVEGKDNNAIGVCSHAEGLGTKAGKDFSHAGGLGTVTTMEAATAIGKYNRSSFPAGKTILEVGAGTGLLADPIDIRYANILECDTCNIVGGFEIRAPLVEVDHIYDDHALITKEYLDSSSAGMWLNDLVDVVSIPVLADIELYLQDTIYRVGDLVHVNGTSSYYMCITEYKSALTDVDSGGNPKPSVPSEPGKAVQFNIESANWTLINDGTGVPIPGTPQPAAQNHLIVYDPTGLGNDQWVSTEDVDFGYYP